MTPYMDALFAKQREFNAQTLRSMETFLEMIKRERERSYHGGLDRYTAWVEMGFKEDIGDLLRGHAVFYVLPHSFDSCLDLRIRYINRFIRRIFQSGGTIAFTVHNIRLDIARAKHGNSNLRPSYLQFIV